MRASRGGDGASVPVSMTMKQARAANARGLLGEIGTRSTLALGPTIARSRTTSSSLGPTKITRDSALPTRASTVSLRQPKTSSRLHERPGSGNS